MTLSFYHQSHSPPRQTIGEAALQLTKMLDGGYPVPKGFIVSGQTCDAFFASGRLKDKILLLLDRCDFHNPEDIARVSKTIKKLIMAAEIPAELAGPMLEASLKLGRSTVILTPSPITQTPAGERILGLSGEAAILMGIRELWASLFNGSELYAIAGSGEFPSLAICVQVEPQGVVSGSLVTSGTDKSACTIMAVWGEGGYIHKLQGADTYILTRGNGTELDKHRVMQPKEVIFAHGKAELKPVPNSRQKKQKLPESALKNLSTLADRIQQDKFFPQEATFVFDGKKVFLIDLKLATGDQPAVAPTVNPAVSRRVLLKGLGMTPGIITGMVRVVRPQGSPLGPGDILVASKLSHLTPDLLRTAKGVIVEEETPASAVVGLANKGIAFLMNASGAVDLLDPGTFITLHTPRGEVLAGGYQSFTREEKEPEPVRLAMRLGTSLSLGSPLHPVGTARGHILLSPNKLITDLGIHPMKLVKDKKTRLLTEAIWRSLHSLGSYHQEAGLIYSFSNLTSDTYRGLSGGGQYENLTEPNPQMGFFGSAKLLSLPQLAKMEIDAVASARREAFGKRISLLLPAVRTTFEVDSWLRLLSQELPRSASLRYFVDLSIPSLCWQLDQIAAKVDGVVLDLDRIASYLFALDPGSDSFHYQPLDLEPALKAVLETVDTLCKQQGIYLILKGEMLNHDPYLSFAVEHGIHELNVPYKDLPRVTERLTVLEQERVTHV